MKSIIKTAALVYLSVSLLLSVLVSSYLLPVRQIVTHRFPFSILEVSRCIVAGIEPDGHIYGYDAGGGYVGFGENIAAFPIGSKVITLFVWNPLNNACDDIIARYDLFVFD